MERNWEITIEPNSRRGLGFIRELLQYKDLISLFVQRDFITLYKQTILGPIWVIIQPILTTLTFLIVFTRIAEIGTDGVPPILFYLLGVTVWGYFSECLVKTSDTFISNQLIFGKVYFPRLVVPISIILTNLIRLAIQMSLFSAVYLIYYATDISGAVHISWFILLLPVLILIMAILGLGIGLIVSALTTKYRDLRFLVQFAVQLLMFASPVVWPLDLIPAEHHWKVLMNPMAGVLETSKVAFFGEEFGVLNWWGLVYSGITSVLLLFIGLRLFSRVEKSFMDTI